MNYTSHTITDDDRITTVRLNKPDRRNALDDVMIRELTEAFNAINRSQTSRVVILTGAGKSFCAGMDLEYLQRCSQLGHEENLEDARNLMKLLQLVNNFKKPVIAMVNGPALGGGCGLAAACDFVFAAKESAKLGTPEVKLGFIPAVILIYLIKKMGEGRAREFVLMGDILDADTAKEKGLVTEVIEDDQLTFKVYEFAKTIVRTTSPSSVSLTKELFSRFDEMDYKSILDYAVNLNALARKTEDFKKGITSFLKKENLEW
ncbi:MAG: enoyl-CoA hydratase/isomerase family protein [Ignavibacteriae bacterium]|nr:enoyl-CoA hydratase/isomerase family protein [Ignavibacteriota bacterium]